jgi:hypothetical protein
MRSKFIYTLAIPLALFSSSINADDIDQAQNMDRAPNGQGKQLSNIPAMCDNNPSNDQAPKDAKSKKDSIKQTASACEPFTGKITKNRVRLRLAPSLDGQIYKELEKDEPLLITGEQDDFYSVMPPKQLKGYIFRTYVLDGIVEGNNVNVRLEPDLQAAVLIQLNSGDHIDGIIAENKPKWLEINLPESVRFYVSKEFVIKAGNKDLYATLQKRKTAIDCSLDEIVNNMDQELRKPLQDITLTPLASKLNQIIAQNSDLPAQVEKAKDLLHHMQEAYLQKSLTNESALLTSDLKTNHLKNNKSQQAVQSSQSTDSNPKQTTEKQVLPQQSGNQAASYVEPAKAPLELTNWSEIEKLLIDEAIANGEAISEDDFYSKEKKSTLISLQGVIKPYDRVVKNRPGDYLLINQKTGLPIAYLYSTRVDLKAFVDKTVTVNCTPRENNHFAFPAYYVQKVQ